MSESTGAVGTISQWRINGNIYDLKDKNLTERLEDYSTSVQVDNKIATALEGISDGIEQEFITDEANATDNDKIYFVYDNNPSEVATFATTEYVDEAINAIELLEGPQGPQGEKGDKGDKGDTGATPDLTGYATTDYVDGQVEGLASTQYVDGQVEGLASTQYVDNLVGQIASQLDEINGEEI